MKKIGILYHPINESAHILAEELNQVLLKGGYSVWLCPAWDEDQAKSNLDGTELLLSIGGDGTILRAAQVALTTDIPITGVNMGNLGFMTELSSIEAKTRVLELMEEKGWLDERVMLEVELPPQFQPRVYSALNDIVMARGTSIKTITIETVINGEPFTTYRADGAILSTPTGSTGYSLAAGGPILSPQADEFLLTPILPHLNLGYSLVLPSDTVVKLILRTTIPAIISIDGHTNITISENTSVTIRRSTHLMRFLRIHPRNSFYRTLEQKLKGKQR